MAQIKTLEQQMGDLLAEQSKLRDAIAKPY